MILPSYPTFDGLTPFEDKILLNFAALTKRNPVWKSDSRSFWEVTSMMNPRDVDFSRKRWDFQHLRCKIIGYFEMKRKNWVISLFPNECGTILRKRNANYKLTFRISDVYHNESEHLWNQFCWSHDSMWALIDARASQNVHSTVGTSQPNARKVQRSYILENVNFRVNFQNSNE